eukprot:gene912-1428_t
MEQEADQLMTGEDYDDLLWTNQFDWPPQQWITVLKVCFQEWQQQLSTLLACLSDMRRDVPGMVVWASEMIEGALPDAVEVAQCLVEDALQFTERVFSDHKATKTNRFDRQFQVKEAFSRLRTVRSYFSRVSDLGGHASATTLTSQSVWERLQLSEKFQHLEQIVQRTRESEIKLIREFPDELGVAAMEPARGPAIREDSAQHVRLDTPQVNGGASSAAPETTAEVLLGIAQRGDVEAVAEHLGGGSRGAAVPAEARQDLEQALRLAVLSQYAKAAQCLLKAGAAPMGVVGGSGNSHVHAAASGLVTEASTAVLLALLQHLPSGRGAAEILDSAVNHAGHTPLHVAARNRRVGHMRQLVVAGASNTPKSRQGQTALQLLASVRKGPPSPREASSAGSAQLLPYSSFLFSKEYSDIQFQVEGEHIHAHRIVVAAASSVYRQMLSGTGWCEVGKDVISLPDIGADAFRGVLRYCYTGDACSQLGLDKAQLLLELLEASERFMIGGLKRQCEETINSFLSNSVASEFVLSFWHAARTFNAASAQMRCEQFIMNEFEHITEADSEVLLEVLDGILAGESQV